MLSKRSKGVFSDLVLYSLSIVIGFSSVPIYLHYLPSDIYGQYLYVVGFVLLLSLLDLGMSQYTIKTLPKFKNIEFFLSIVQTYQYVLALFLLFSGTTIWFLFEPSEWSSSLAFSDKTYLFLMVWFSYAVKSLYSSVQSLLRYREDFVFVNAVILTESIFILLITLFFLMNDVGVFSFGYSTIICSFITGFLYLYRVGRNDCRYLYIFRWDFETLLEGVKYVANFQLMRLSLLSRDAVTPILISKLAGAGTLTQYAISSRVPYSMPTIFSKVLLNFFPMLSRLFSSGDIEKVRECYSTIYYASCNVIFLITLGVLSLNSAFIELWVGSGLGLGSDYEWVISLFLFIRLYSACLGLLIQCSGEFKLLPAISVIELAIFVLFSYFLYEKMGIYSVLFGLIVNNLISTTYMFVYATKRLELNLIKISLNSLINLSPFILIWCVILFYKAELGFLSLGNALEFFVLSMIFITMALPYLFKSWRVLNELS